MARGGHDSPWRRDGDWLIAADPAHPRWRTFADQRLLHRLRRLRASPRGLLHPIEAELRDGSLAMRFVPGDLDGRGPLLDSDFPRWLARCVRPLVEAMNSLHDQGVAGLGGSGIAGGRWVAPPAWFLREGLGPADPRQVHADREAVRAWLRQNRRTRGRERDHRDERLLDQVDHELRSMAPPPTLTQFLGQRIDHWLRDRRQGDDPPRILSLFTEAELLERMGTVHRYRVLDRDELTRLALPSKADLVLEIDPTWKDPHFPDIDRPSIQDLWEELVADQQATVQLRLCEHPPNALLPAPRPQKGDPPWLRWIGVHDDQPLLFTDRPFKRIPRRGWLHPLLPGDDALLIRKRLFTSFAADHPSLDRWLDAPPAPRPFQANTVDRAELEDAILGSRGAFVVQGPPGTGKTHLATEVVCRFLADRPGRRVLVCSKEHFALGHIQRKITSSLEEAEIPFRAYRSVSLARLARRSGEQNDPWLGRNAALELASRDWQGDAVGWLPWQAATAEDHDGRLDSLARDSATLFFCTTMDAVMVEFCGSESFDLVVVEEAGKCYPSEILHALCLGRTSLLIGDHLQLPPYQERRTREAVDAWRKLIRRTKDPKVEAEAVGRLGPVLRGLLGLADSRPPPSQDELGWLRTFEFLWERSTGRFRLEEQFRMEEALSDLVGTVFYGRPFIHRKGELVRAGLIPERPLGDLIPTELDLALLWIDTPHTTVDPDAGEDQGKAGIRDNQHEVDTIVRYLRRLQPDGDADLVILTPYRAQKRLLLDSRPLQEACARLTRQPMAGIVRTTDEYQGREAELTVLSLVRNNAQGARAWGFMTELERLNVMFSRARFRQVVVGCSAHVERHAEEASYLADVWREYRRAEELGRARIIPSRELGRG